MQEILLVVNDSPYGSEKAYNALRTAMNLQKKDEEVQVNIFLLDDGVIAAKANQQTPKGYYNVERMFKAVLRKDGFVKTWGSCSETRGVSKEEMIDGIEVSGMADYTDWVLSADKVLTF